MIGAAQRYRELLFDLVLQREVGRMRVGRLGVVHVPHPTALGDDRAEKGFLVGVPLINRAHGHLRGLGELGDRDLLMVMFGTEEPRMVEKEISEKPAALVETLLVAIARLSQGESLAPDESEDTEA